MLSNLLHYGSTKHSHGNRGLVGQNLCSSLSAVTFYFHSVEGTLDESIDILIHDPLDSPRGPQSYLLKVIKL